MLIKLSGSTFGPVTGQESAPVLGSSRGSSVASDHRVWCGCVAAGEDVPTLTALLSLIMQQEDEAAFWVTHSYTQSL